MPLIGASMLTTSKRHMGAGKSRKGEYEMSNVYKSIGSRSLSTHSSITGTEYGIVAAKFKA